MAHGMMYTHSGPHSDARTHCHTHTHARANRHARQVTRTAARVMNQECRLAHMHVRTALHNVVHQVQSGLWPPPTSGPHTLWTLHLARQSFLRSTHWA